MKNLILIGARGYGREIFGDIHYFDEYKRGEWSIKGFLDSDAHALDGYACAFGEYPPILGAPEEYEPQPDDIFFCALGDPGYRRKYAEMILAKGGQFVSLIHPEAAVSPGAKVGVGCVISKWCTVSNNVTIGDFTTVHSFCTMGHDVKIGAYNAIESYCFFGGYSQTGDNVTCHPRVSFIPHKKVGNNVTIGAHSVVMRNFGDNLHLFGIPAKKLEF